MSTHICDAFVVACIDFRFQKYIKNWLEKNFQNKTYDYVGFAGATKDLETIKKQLDISVRLHHIKEVVLIHHEDCGAYGVESNYDRHAEDLKKARQTINTLYPNLIVDLFYLHLDGEFEKIN
jgi:carbonic anhydrase